MAQKTVEHKGYHGSIKVNTGDYSLFGRILFIDEEMEYKGSTFAEMETAFRKAVETHIKSCVESGKQIPFTE